MKNKANNQRETLHLGGWVLVFQFIFIGCGGTDPGIDQAIEAIQSGALAQAIEENRENNSISQTVAFESPEIPRLKNTRIIENSEFPKECEFEVPENKKDATASATKLFLDFFRPHLPSKPKLIKDFNSPLLPAPHLMGMDPKRNFALEALLGACLRKIYETPSTTRKVIDTVKKYQFGIISPPISTQTHEEHLAFLQRREKIENKPVEEFFKAGSLIRMMMRRSFNDDELNEIEKLSRRLTQELVESRKILFAFLDKRSSEITDSHLNNRYKAIDIFYQNRDQTKVHAGLSKIYKLINGKTVSNKILYSLPVEAIYTYGLASQIPKAGWDIHQPIYQRDEENPFKAAAYPYYHLNGDATAVARSKIIYRTVKNSEVTAKLAKRAIPAKNPVRLVFIDSGVDLIKYAHVGLTTFMSFNEKNRVASYDHQDLDDNVHIPDIGILGHGTSVMGTALHLLGRIDPKILKDRKLDIGMWKIFTSNIFLGYEFSYKSNQTWKAHPFSVVDSLIQNIQPSSKRPQPDIVSVSMVFSVYPALAFNKKENLINASPWLWVMASGNNGLQVKTYQNSCFHDFPAKLRPKNRILCVGAIIPGFGEDMIAAYSNYGPGVDLYTYQSFVPSCPNGTSCATPAISAMAVTLKHLFPKITPEQIKKSLIAAAEQRRLLLDPQVREDNTIYQNPLPEYSKQYRTIPFFDPQNPEMRQKAIDEARKLLEPPKNLARRSI